MIKGYELIERMYSDYDEYEDTRLYSTGDSDLDELLEKAFCDGYEYAQREFVGKSDPSLNFMGQKNGVSKITGSQVKAAMNTRTAPQIANIDKTINANAKIVESRKKGLNSYDTKESPFFGTKANALFHKAGEDGNSAKISTLNKMSFGKGTMGRVRKGINKTIPSLYKTGKERWNAAFEVAGTRL